MIQTLEAVVDEKGKISLLTKARLTKGRRALVTVLDEEQKLLPEPNIGAATFEEVSDKDVLGVWAGRKESAAEIARAIRENNRN